MQNERMNVSSKRYWRCLDISTIRKAQIAACLDAMIHERRFMYIDLFVRK